MEQMDEIEIIDNIEKAITLLKSKCVLFAIVAKEKTFFVEKKSKIFIINQNSSYSLSYDQFKELFESTSFVEYKENEDTIDIARDEEYYSWKHK